MLLDAPLQLLSHRRVCNSATDGFTRALPSLRAPRLEVGSSWITLNRFRPVLGCFHGTQMPSGGLGFQILSKDKRQQMLHNFVTVLCSAILATSGLMTFISFAVMAVGLFQSAARRCDGVSYLAAAASKNIIYRPELYKHEAARPRRLHGVGLVGMILFPLLVISVGSFLKWIVQ